MAWFISTSKKSQVWGFDLMIAITIFLVGIVVTYMYAINFLNEAQETLETLSYEGNLASSLILSEGTSEDWHFSPENVEIPGILTGKRINQEKLDAFYFLIQNDYSNIKNLLGTQYEFYFNFTGIKSSGQEITGIGNPPDNPKNMIKIERFTIYENKPVKFVLFMWN